MEEKERISGGHKTKKKYKGPTFGVSEGRTFVFLFGYPQKIY
jgi:hypothetical protein